jgi:hypothetical protein
MAPKTETNAERRRSIMKKHRVDGGIWIDDTYQPGMEEGLTAKRDEQDSNKKHVRADYEGETGDAHTLGHYR